MAELNYSNDASNILSLFYRSDAMVYVEGKDDVPFWEFLFSKLFRYNVEIQDVGGSNELTAYINKINNHEINDIVACDSDFEVLKGLSPHNNIIRTYGYSIENTLICKSTIGKVIRSIGKLSSKSVPNSVIEEWVNSLYLAIEDLVIYDVANELKSNGVSVLGDNCSKFLKSKNSPELCPSKIEKFIDELPIEVEETFKKEIEELISELSRETKNFLRGHFLLSAVAKFVVSVIKQLDKKVSISNDALYGSLLLAFENIFNDRHPEYTYYAEALNNIVIAA